MKIVLNRVKKNVGEQDSSQAEKAVGQLVIEVTRKNDKDFFLFKVVTTKIILNIKTRLFNITLIIF